MGQGGWQRTACAVALALATAYFLQTACKFHIADLAVLSGDASIIFNKVLGIARDGRYPAQFAHGNFYDIFPYPPPSVLMFAASASLGPAAFMASWEALTFAALFAVVRFSMQYESDVLRRAWPLLLVPAILLTYNPIEYDLIGRNDNLIILALTLLSFAMLGSRPALSGITLALAISLKLYSGLLLVWLIFFNRRAALSCIAALVILWVIAPLAYWGGAGAVQIYRDWLDQLAIANGRWVYELRGNGIGFGPPLITLRLAASSLLDADPFGSQVRGLLIGLQAVWVGVLGIYVWRAWWRRPRWSAWRAVLADWFVLLVAPLPFSPWFEPYHAVALIPGFVLCILVAIDRTQTGTARIAVATACIASAIIKELPIPFDVRGLLFTAQFAFVILALSFVRHGLKRDALAAAA